MPKGATVRTPRFIQSGQLLRKLGKMPEWMISGISEIFTRYYLWHINRIPFPEQLTIFLTESCNINCPHCFLGDVTKRPAHRISALDIKKLCMKNRKNLKRIILTGGEIFTLPDIGDIFFIFDTYAHLENMTVTTNAFFDEKIIRLVDKFLDKGHTRLSVQISLDGPESYHDAFRGCPGLFRKATDLARTLKNRHQGSHNFERAFFCIVLTVGNIPLLTEMISQVRLSGIEAEWAFMRSPLRSVSGVSSEYLTSWNPQHDNLMLDISQMEYAYRTLHERLWGKRPVLTPSDAANRVRMEKVIEYYKTGRWSMPCTAGKSDAVITPDGQIAVCEMTAPLVSLKDFDWDLSELTEKISLKEMAQKLKCSCAHECNHGNALRTHRRGIVEIIKILGGRL